MTRIGYTLQAIHAGAVYPVPPIISIRLPEAAGMAIVRDVWPDVDFLAAPGGGSKSVETAKQLDDIMRMLGRDRYFLSFDPARHRWLFHVHLVEENEWP